MTPDELAHWNKALEWINASLTARPSQQEGAKESPSPGAANSEGTSA